MLTYSLKKRVLFFLVIAAVFLQAHSVSAQNIEDADIVIAKDAFKNGLYDIAGERFEAILRNYPDTARVYEIHSLLGKCYYYQNKLSRASYEFDIVINAPAGSDSQDEALYWSGETSLKSGELKKALGFYQQIIDAFPSSKYISYALYSKGWCYYKLDLLEDAVSCFKDTAAKYPLEKAAPEAQFLAGECHYLMARYAPAEKELKEFTEKFPLSGKTAEAYYLLGETSFYLSKYTDAVNYFRRALAISPTAAWAPFAEYRIAAALYQAGDYTASIKGYRKCLARRSSGLIEGSILLGLARNYEKTGMTADAMEAYDGVIAMRSRGDVVAEAYYRKARLLSDLGRHDEAERLCREGIEKFPDSKYADNLHSELARSYSMQDAKQGDAIKEFRRVCDMSKDPSLIADALVGMGDIYLAAKDEDKAIASYDMALNRYPDSRVAAYAQIRLGDVFLETGNLDQAALAYQSALANFPDTSFKEKVLLSLAIVDFRKGDFERAVSGFTNLFKAFPGNKNNARIRLYLADSMYNAGDYPAALAIYQEIEKDAVSVELKAAAGYQAGWSLLNMGRDSQAIDEFGRLLKNYPLSGAAYDARFELAEYYASKGKYDTAREYYYSIAKAIPAVDLTERALYEAALTYCRQDRMQEAVDGIDELAVRFPGSVYARNGYRKIANIKKDSGDFAGSVVYLRKALGSENNELNAQVQYEIAEAIEKVGALQGAAAEYLKVPELYPKGAFWAVRAQLRSAQIFEKTGAFGEAGKLYEKLADMDVEESSLAKERLQKLRKIK